MPTLLKIGIIADSKTLLSPFICHTVVIRSASGLLSREDSSTNEIANQESDSESDLTNQSRGTGWAFLCI